MARKKRKLTIQLPDEFLELCEYDMVSPDTVLRGFIADLSEIINWASDPRTDGYSSNGSDERMYARKYYDRVGYPYEAQYMRDAALVQPEDCSKSSGHFNCRHRSK